VRVCCDRGDIVDQSVLQFFPPVQPDGMGSKELVREKVQAALKGVAQSFECQVRRLDGKLVDTEISMKSVPVSGRPVLQTIIRDITERRLKERTLIQSHDRIKLRIEERTAEWKEEKDNRKRVEMALEASEALNRSVVTHAPVAIFSLDSDGKVLSANPATYQMLNLSEDEFSFKGSKIQELPHMTFLGIERIVQRILTAEVISGEEMEFQTAQGHKKLLEIRAAPRLDPSGRIDGAVLMCVDISEYKELEAQLLQSQKMEAVGRLAGGVAHDFNNMITVISGFSDFLHRRLDQESSLHRYVDEIRKAGKRAASLTQQLLAFSRRQVLEARVMNLNLIVSDMEQMLRPIIGEHIELVTDLSPELGLVKADPTQIEQVIMNLAVNARDAMPGGGRLSLRTANINLDQDEARGRVDFQSGSFVTLVVQDTGEGMDNETLKHIFEPFYTTKKKGEGTGLGLAMVYGIVKQSGGHIEIHSQPGEGTTFTILLPRVEEKIESVEPVTVTSCLSDGSETILVVEDDEAVRKMICESLLENKYMVMEACNGKEAIGVVEKHADTIDMIVTDVVMPQMSGLELAEHLKSLHPDIKMLCVSGYSDEVIVNRGVLDAGLAFLKKPFSMDDFHQKVREILDAS